MSRRFLPLRPCQSRDWVASSLTAALFLSLPLAAPACTSDPLPGDPGTGGSGATGGSLASGGSVANGGSGGAGGTGGSEPGTTTLTATFGPVTIQSGEEAVKCIVVSLDNANSVFVRKFRTTLNEGSHHMIVYKTDQPPDPTPFPCMSFGVQGGSAIFIAQQAKSELTLPKTAEGTPVGLELTAHQNLTLEVHYLNPTAAPLDVEGSIHLDVLPATSNIVPSGFLFQGAFDIPEIPANGEADTGVRFQEVTPGTKVFALTTHQHHLGTNMRVWHATDVNDLSTLVADSKSWSDPPLELFDPPLDFDPSNPKGLAYQCHWKNTTPNPVYGGLSANDEMCFFWSYYYPAP